MLFTDPFDEELANTGPASLFTLSHDGELQIDVMRTRELRRQHQGPFPKEHCHCVLIDQATQWPQYALLTSPGLCAPHERGSIVRYASYEEALRVVEECKQEYYLRNS